MQGVCQSFLNIVYGVSRFNDVRGGTKDSEAKVGRKLTRMNADGVIDGL